MTNKEKADEIAVTYYNPIFGGYLFSEFARDEFLRLMENPEAEYLED